MAFAFEDHDIITPEIASRWEAICAKDYAKHPEYPVLDIAVQRCLEVINRFDYAHLPTSNRDAELTQLAQPLSRLREVRDLMLDQLYTRCMENIAFRTDKMKEKPKIDLDKEAFLQLATDYAQSGGLTNPAELSVIHARLETAGIPEQLENIKWEVMDYISEAARTGLAFDDVDKAVRYQLKHTAHVPIGEFDIVLGRCDQHSLRGTKPEATAQVIEADPIQTPLKEAEIIDLNSRRK